MSWDYPLEEWIKKYKAPIMDARIDRWRVLNTIEENLIDLLLLEELDECSIMVTQELARILAYVNYHKGDWKLIEPFYENIPSFFALAEDWCCIQLFRLEQADEWSKRLAFAYVEDDMLMAFDEWEDDVCDYWFAVTSKGWSLEESLEEAIIQAFALLGLPYDENDVDLLYNDDSCLYDGPELDYGNRRSDSHD